MSRTWTHSGSNETTGPRAVYGNPPILVMYAARRLILVPTELIKADSRRKSPGVNTAHAVWC